MLPGTEDEEPEELPGPVEGRGWPLSEDEEIEEPAPEPERDENDPSHLWVGRLVCDPSVSADSPVVRGTWITVRHVVSLVIDGWTWADILRAHPELTEDDIRACLTYATEEENASLPL
ncbi:MAG: DUF433 domain-containing protein [Isosphaeraceae bacterium]|nr:DUF433 domain-containing protein [Isosphaeraceae bacterium]